MIVKGLDSVYLGETLWVFCGDKIAIRQLEYLRWRWYMQLLLLLCWCFLNKSGDAISVVT